MMFFFAQSIVALIDTIFVRTISAAASVMEGLRVFESRDVHYRDDPLSIEWNWNWLTEVDD